ncbi:WbqC family protein [Vicingaceae bacterium]|nr:WbqC family protein [Vicingaceae bacterium]
MTNNKVVSIVQSSYIPWKGYFDIIDRSDHFILLDDVQFTKRDWRTRNKIKTPNDEKWLSIPVNKGSRLQRIFETEIHDSQWNTRHWSIIENAYRKAPYFNEYSGFVKGLYENATQTSLSEINHHFLVNLCQWLGIDTPISWSMDYGINTDDATVRLVQLCQAENASTYVSGPSASDYINVERFEDAGIEVVFFEYDGYKAYEQLSQPFTHFVSILDMIFMCGKQSLELIRENTVAGLNR